MSNYVFLHLLSLTSTTRNNVIIQAQYPEAPSYHGLLHQQTCQLSRVLRWSSAKIWGFFLFFFWSYLEQRVRRIHLLLAIFLKQRGGNITISRKPLSSIGQQCALEKIKKKNDQTGTLWTIKSAHKPPCARLSIPIPNAPRRQVGVGEWGEKFSVSETTGRK